jgi:hypothetical protein
MTSTQCKILSISVGFVAFNIVVCVGLAIASAGYTQGSFKMSTGMSRGKCDTQGCPLIELCGSSYVIVDNTGSAFCAELNNLPTIVTESLTLPMLFFNILVLGLLSRTVHVERSIVNNL